MSPAELLAYLNSVEQASRKIVKVIQHFLLLVMWKRVVRRPRVLQTATSNGIQQTLTYIAKIYSAKSTDKQNMHQNVSRWDKQRLKR